jgi:hypothetical protein
LISGSQVRALPIAEWDIGDKEIGQLGDLVRAFEFSALIPSEGPGLNADFTMAVRNAANDVRAEEQR